MVKCLRERWIHFFPCYFINSVCIQNSERDDDIYLLKLLISPFALIGEKENSTVLFMVAWENDRENDRTTRIHQPRETSSDRMLQLCICWWEKARWAWGGKTSIRQEAMSSFCLTVRKSRLLCGLSGTFCNASSSTSVFTSLTPRCTRQYSNVVWWHQEMGGTLTWTESIQSHLKDTHLH